MLMTSKTIVLVSKTLIYLVVTSKVLLKNITIDLPSREDRGWTDVEDKDLFRAIVAELRERRSTTTLSIDIPNDKGGISEGTSKAAKKKPAHTKSTSG